MPEVTVVGSGPSGVHFALSLLEKGYRVHMIDVGRSGEDPPAPEVPLEQLTEELGDPVRYFLGEEFESVSLPGPGVEYYGFPPSKTFVFDAPEGADYRADGFAPLSSFARGGLARVWTGSVYPFNDDDLADFPFSYDDLAPHYATAARRIGVTGRPDDLDRFFPLHPGLDEPLRLDPHSDLLLRTYERKRDRLRRDLGFSMGHARLAVLSRSHGERGPCEYLGRCLWGCPVESLYTPDQTLRECRRHEGFRYTDGHFVERFRVGDGRRVAGVVARRLEDGRRREFDVATLALAAGALSSSRIFLDSLERATGRRPRLEGLMDNRQVLLPFVNLRRLGAPYEPGQYQYHQLAAGLETDRAEEYVHVLVTALGTGMAHPVVESVPLDVRGSVAAFRSVRSALGLLNVNFHDRRRTDCFMEWAPGPEGTGEAYIRYRPPEDEERRIRAACRRIRRALLRLGCVVPPGTAHVRPMGSSVHYAGTLPMARRGGSLTVTPSCRSNDFENLYLVDGATFPFLPSKNITFTLMANAIRVADDEF